jgi:hypothetical protein
VGNQPLGLGIDHPALPPIKLMQGVYNCDRPAPTSSPAEQVPRIRILKGAHTSPVRAAVSGRMVEFEPTSSRSTMPEQAIAEIS